MIKLKKMPKVVLTFMLAGSLLGGAFWFPTPSFAKTDGIAAIVNENVILESDINNLTKRVIQQTDKKDLPEKSVLRKQIIDQLINETLIIQQARKANIAVSDQELDQAIQNIASQNNLTKAQLIEYLKSIGLNYDLYKEQIRRDMIMDQIRLAELRDRITVSDYEINDITKNIKQQSAENYAVDLSHILVALPENPTSAEVKAARQKVNLILEQLSKGDSFTKLAMTYSDDDLALNGGEMGWTDVYSLPSLFESHVVYAKKGQVIGPVRSNAGFHLLKVKDVKTHQAPTVKVHEVHAKHILLTTNMILDDAQAKAKLEQLRADILSGSITFEKAASLYSEDPGSVNKGGDLGWASPDVYDQTFRQALLKLNQNEISEPIKSQFGWHLIEMEGSRTVDESEIAKKDQAYRIIFNRKFNEESLIWTQALRGDAYIKVFDEDGNE